MFILLFGDTRVRDNGPPGMRTDDRRWQFTFTSTLAIAYQYMHLAAASLGLATRWVSAVSTPAAEEQLKSLLGIPQEFAAYDMLALGYSDFEPHDKKLRPLDKVMHSGKCAPADFRTEEQVRAYFEDLVFETTVPLNVKVEEAHARGLSVGEYAPESPGARAYLSVTEQILAHEQEKTDDRAGLTSATAHGEASPATDTTEG